MRKEVSFLRQTAVVAIVSGSGSVTRLRAAGPGGLSGSIGNCEPVALQADLLAERALFRGVGGTG